MYRRIGAEMTRMIARLCVACAALLLCWPAMGSANMKLLHSERSLYRDVMVYEYDGQRCICFVRECRLGRQSCSFLAAPGEFVMDYTKMVLAGSLALDPDPKAVLIIGLGGGTLPTAMAKLLPQARIDVVEIDPAVTQVAKKYFSFRDGGNTRVYEMDARVFVKRAGREGRKYDLVVLDAFDREYIPEHLLTREYLTEVKALLKPGSVLAANTFSGTRLYDHESVTYASVYGTFFNLKRGNRVILTRIGGNPTPEAIRANIERHAAALAAFVPDPGWIYDLFSTEVDWDPKARVLTDQFSPANLLNR
jgi:spermidine synthase